MVKSNHNVTDADDRAPDSSPATDELRLQGIAVSPGVAVARVCMFSEDRHAGIEEYSLADDEVAAERDRLATALERAKAKLSETAEKVARMLGRAEADIFVVQQTIMEDHKALEKIHALIETEKVNAESAVTRVFTEYETRFAELSNDYLRDRASDIAEARQRLLDALTDLRPGLACEGFQHCRRGRDRIIVARELTPALTVELDTEHVRGFVTERGGATSHAAILARSLGIPSVSGVDNILQHVACGVSIFVNGNTGDVILRPTPATLKQHPALTQARRGITVEPPLPDFAVMANINTAHTGNEAKRAQADGIGLYRTEFECIVAGRMLSEDEQLQRYRKVVETMDGKPVYFRLLDMGGDKGGDIVGMPEEENPSLGMRGARLLLKRADLLDPQLRALARTAEKAPISILYPMIVDLDQFLALRQRMLDVLADYTTHPVRHGVMFEVPAACLQADDLLQHADFGSIGTNDLAQYLFAADRDNQYVINDLLLDGPVFWTFIENLVAAGRRVGKPLSVCGEVATQEAHLRRMQQMGLRSVSVNVQSIAGVRRTLKAAH